MNKKTLVLSALVIVVIIGIVSVVANNSSTTVTTQPSAAIHVPSQSAPSAAATVTASSSSVPLMQSTGVAFASYKYYNKAHQVFPALASDTIKAMGAFSYTKTDLGNNTYRITLVNGAEGFQGQSVTVSGDQSVYFIEPSLGDDSASEDSVITDDFLVAVDVQGNILK